MAVPSAEPPAPGRTPHLPFLDGLRGLAAVMVVVTHLPVWGTMPPLIGALSWGNPWVAVFIVLSGWVLYLPAAARERIEMPRPLASFMARRARRLLPAWYASLLLCITVGLWLRHWQLADAHFFLPQDAWDMLAHGTLLHSLTRYSGSINGPGYTLGIEWILYLLLAPFLWVARRAGWAALIVFVLLCSITSLVSPPAAKSLGRILSPTFTLPFVLGVIGARLARRPPRILQKEKGGQMALVGVVLGILGYALVNPHHHEVACWFIGLAVMAACFSLSQFPASLAARLLSSRPLLWLGGISYSLYLTHLPLLIVAKSLRVHSGLWAGAHGWVCLILLWVPGIFAFAWAFSRCFEQPFLNTVGARGRPVSSAPRSGSSAQVVQ